MKRKAKVTKTPTLDKIIVVGGNVSADFKAKLMQKIAEEVLRKQGAVK